MVRFTLRFCKLGSPSSRTSQQQTSNELLRGAYKVHKRCLHPIKFDLTLIAAPKNAISMEQDKRAVPEGRGGEVPAGEKPGDDEDPPHGDASPQQEGSSAADRAGRDAAAEHEEEDLKEALEEGTERVAVASNAGRGTASGSTKNEDLEVPKNTLAPRSRFRAAIMHPTPPTTYRRLLLGSRKQYNPTLFRAAGSVPATTRSAGVSAMSPADQGAMNEAQGSTVTCSVVDTTVDGSSSDESKNGTDATNAAASSSAFMSHRLPSRSRKQRRPDHYIPEEAEATAHARAHRSNMVLDRFLTSMLRVPPDQRPEWARNLTADDDRGQEQPEEGPEEEPDGRAILLTVLAVLGASMALRVVSCVLFYITAQRTERDHQE